MIFLKKKTEAGELICKYTKNKAISFIELSQKLKISYSYLIKILIGERNITDEIYNKMCNIFNLNKFERNKLREAVFISNPFVMTTTSDKRQYILKLLYVIIQKHSIISQEQASQCIQILNDSKNQSKNNLNNHQNQKRT